MADGVTHVSDPQLQERLGELRQELASRRAAGKGCVADGDGFDLSLFLLECDLNVRKSADAFNSAARFRRDNGGDEARAAVRKGMLPDDFPGASAIKAVWDTRLCGEDTPDSVHGMPTAVTCIGSADVDKLVATVPLPLFKQYMMHVMEYRLAVMEQRTKDAGGRIVRWIDVHDMHSPKGLFHVFSRDNVSHFKWWLGSLAPHYPEQVRKVFVVNCPGAFTGGWKMVKVWLPKKALDRTALVKTEFSEVREFVPPEKLPIFLGKTSDVEASRHVDGPGQGKATVPRGKDLGLSLSLNGRETCAWRFGVQGGDSKEIRYSVHFVCESGTQTVVARSKLAGSDGFATGSFTAAEDGVLAIRWQNPSSVRAKELAYFVTVE
eukprot:TRINITY_DN42884_c0_g1_i1.p1 TRINITY_DN42884_c0_g1~~TRINITY_DN42884_c0_g1_i1.p1  ORF type:complete len:398 (+),score=131.99 TRINITY_DN42884_c0_g1_i1:61-1194(+)